MIFKTILLGFLLGATLFFVPFLVLGLVTVFALMRIFGRRRFRNGNFMQHRIAWADKIRSMSEEDYASLKEKAASGDWRSIKQSFHNQY